jgi:hypothetical protein
MHQAYGDDAVRRAAGLKWWKRFWNGETNVEDEPRSGRPSTAPVPLSSWSLRQTVRSTFSRSGWSVVRSASLAKGRTSKKRPSPRFHEVPTRSNKASPRTFETALLNPFFMHTSMNIVPKCYCFLTKKNNLFILKDINLNLLFVSIIVILTVGVLKE